MNWLQTVGRRNVAYVAFIAALIPIALLVEANGPQGPDSGGGAMFGFIIWAFVSAGFFLVNAILVIRALVKGLPPQKPLIACALPLLIVIGTLLVEDIVL